ncbi:restriction endonuclease subunit S [Fibrobacter sp.]|uniref:restriction endonuclease subunit S n=1 Tax=Fibrobacter sp. TaxID=35828 RepID=UPI00388E27F8
MSASIWRKCNLKQFATIYSGTDYKHNKKGEDFPIIGTGGIMGYTGDFLNEGPAVLTGRKGTIDRPIYIEGKFWNVDTIFCIKPFDFTNVKYLYYALSNKNLLLLNEATGVPSVSSDNLYKQSFILPKDSEEQKHIADILSTCDTIIQNTQKTIDKYKAIKQGMMQDLFTRGLTKDGKLRPSYKEAPELYKESELGMIPKEWNVDCIGNNYMTYAGGTPSREHEEYYKGTIPWVSSSECNQFEINDTNEHITEFAIQNSSTKMVKAGAILLALYGATAGQVAKLNIDATTNQAVLACLSDTKNDNNYLYYYINYIKEKMLYLAQGSGQPNLSKASVDKFIYLMPQKNEQIEIAKRLSSIDSTIQKEETILAKYKKIKTGLMARLLAPPENAEIINETGE